MEKRCPVKGNEYSMALVESQPWILQAKERWERATASRKNKECRPAAVLDTLCLGVSLTKHMETRSWASDDKFDARGDLLKGQGRYQMSD